MPFTFDKRMILALMIGFFYCLIVSIMSGWREPWDTQIYWLPGLMITFILATVMGWFFRSVALAIGPRYWHRPVYRHFPDRPCLRQ